MLNGLDLFSGIGGLALALSKWARPRYYCEFDRYAQGVLLSRMSNGDLPLAPIWDDVRTLEGRLLEFPIDIIWGGFPCQDISVAGNGIGLGGERSGLFHHIARLIEETNPRFVFLENVPAIRTRGLNGVVQTLTELGYDCRWTVVSAAEVGAPHLRKRWFLLAHNMCYRGGIQSKSRGKADTNIINDGQEKSMANSNSERLQESWTIGSESKITYIKSYSDKGKWWTTEPNVGRVVNGLPHRVDRIKGLGNAVVPAQAKTAFERLMGLAPTDQKEE